jgi:hypothetical protein
MSAVWGSRDELDVQFRSHVGWSTMGIALAKRPSHFAVRPGASKLIALIILTQEISQAMEKGIIRDDSWIGQEQVNQSTQLGSLR